MLRPILRFVSGQNTVCYNQVYDLLLFRTPYVMISNSYIQIDCCVHIVFDQVYDFLLVKTLYVTTKFMICYWSERCMLRPSLWFVTGQNTMVWPSLWFVTGQNAVCYDQVYDLLRSEHCMLRPSWWFVTGQNTMLWPSLWFVTGRNTVCYDQVYDLLLVRILYVTTKLMICCWSECCMLRPSL